MLLYKFKSKVIIFKKNIKSVVYFFVLIMMTIMLSMPNVALEQNSDVYDELKNAFEYGKKQRSSRIQLSTT